MKRILFLSLAVIFTSCFEFTGSGSSDDSANKSGQNISQDSSDITKLNIDSLKTILDEKDSVDSDRLQEQLDSLLALLNDKNPSISSKLEQISSEAFVISQTTISSSSGTQDIFNTNSSIAYSSGYVSSNVISSSTKSPIEQPVLIIQNPSFEENLPTICEGGNRWFCPKDATIRQREAGDPGMFGIDKIDPWEQCSGTLDLLPNAPELRPNITASDGDWYVGLVCDGGNIETFGQHLSAPFTAGVNYSFQVDLAHSVGGYADGNAWELDKPGILKIYGGESSCDATEQLLWQSPPIDHADWKTYEITFTPTLAWSHIHITTAGKTEGGCEVLKSNLLLDNIGNFVPGG